MRYKYVVSVLSTRPKGEQVFEIRGGVTKIRVMAASLEEAAMSQVYAMASHPAFEGSSCVIMPDAHSGMGAVIGWTSTLHDRVIPNVVGVDIGCGVLTIQTKRPVRKLNFEKIDRAIRESIPSGFGHREGFPSQWWAAAGYTDSDHNTLVGEVRSVCSEIEESVDKVLRQVGTLGGGNHFIEIDEGPEGEAWLTVHSGSRNFGLRVAQFYQRMAKLSHPRADTSWLEGPEAIQYFESMKVAQKFADINRNIMSSILLDIVSDEEHDRVHSVHNFIDFTASPFPIIRKGAISARAGERVVIPLNMREGIILGTGTGNPDWNASAPHGAGRKMSRSHAKAALNVQYFQKVMRGVWSSCVSKDTLDESPMAYKDPKEILDIIVGQCIDSEYRVLKPVYNFKAGGE